MDFSSLPPYRGLDDDTPEHDRRPVSWDSPEVAVGIVILAILVVAAVSAAMIWFVASTLPVGPLG